MKDDGINQHFSPVEVLLPSEEVARRLRLRGLAPGVQHRDIAKGG